MEVKSVPEPENPLAKAIRRLSGQTTTIVFPEGTDPRIQRAAIRISELLPTLELILLGPRDIMPTTLEIHDRMKIIDPSDHPAVEQLAALY